MGIFDLFKSGNGKADSDSSLPKHEPNWVAYIASIDEGAVGSIVVDLGLRDVAPVASLTELLIIEVPIQNIDDNGFPASEEFEVLSDIEESFQANLADNVPSIFAGHLHCEGKTTFYFYVEKGSDFEEVLNKSISPFEQYSFEYRRKDDPEWEGYFDFLHPAPIEMQRIGNDQVIRNLTEHGDQLEKERKVEHWIYFGSESDRSEFLASISDLGFTVEDLSREDESELPYKAQISRDDAVTTEATDEYILDLWQRAKDYNGNYDGWETFIVKE